MFVSVLMFFDSAMAVASILSSLEMFSSSTNANKEALIMEPLVVAHLHWRMLSIIFNSYIVQFIRDEIITVMSSSK